MRIWWYTFLVLSLVTEHKYSTNQSVILMSHNSIINNHYYCSWELVPCGQLLWQKYKFSRNRKQQIFSLYLEWAALSENLPCWTATWVSFFSVDIITFSFILVRPRKRSSQMRTQTFEHFQWPWFLLWRDYKFGVVTGAIEICSCIYIYMCIF